MERSQPVPGSEECRPINRDELFHLAVGGPSHGRLFGFGSHAGSFYGEGATSSSSVCSFMPSESQSSERLQQELQELRDQLASQQEQQRVEREREREMWNKRYEEQQQQQKLQMDQLQQSMMDRMERMMQFYRPNQFAGPSQSSVDPIDRTLPIPNDNVFGVQSPGHDVPDIFNNLLD